MARVDRGADIGNRGNGIELDENASDESDFFLVHTGRGDSAIHKTRPAGLASAPAGVPPPPREPPPPAGRNSSPSFSNTVSGAPERRARHTRPQLLGTVSGRVLGRLVLVDHPVVRLRSCVTPTNSGTESQIVVRNHK